MFEYKNYFTYIKFILNRNKSLNIFSSILVSLMVYLLVWFITLFDVTQTFSSMMSLFPKALQVFINDQFVTSFTLTGSIAFAFNHPVVLSMLIINAIIIPYQHIGKEIQEGTLELLLSFPVKRIFILLSVWLSIIIQILCIIVVGYLVGLFAILYYHSLSQDVLIKMFKICFNLWVFISLIGTLGLTLSVFSKKNDNTGLRTAGIVLVFYMFHIISSLWSQLQIIKPYNIFSYYEPQKLILGQASFVEHIIVIISLLIILLSFSMNKFIKRDIP